MSQRNILITSGHTKRSKEAYAFAVAQYQERLKVIPSDAQEYVYMLDESNNALGVVGLDRHFAGEKLFYETVYDISKKPSLEGFSRMKAVYFSKFTTVASWASPVVMHEAVMRGLSLGCKYGIAILNERMVYYLNEKYKMSWKCWSEVLLTENVPSEVITYFSQEPKPKLYLANLQEIDSALNSFDTL